MDSIKRQDAIDALCNQCSMTKAGDRCTDDFCRDVRALKKVPSAQKKGEWIEVEVIADAYDISGVKTWASKMRCDQCCFTTIAIEGCFSQYNFCPNCGADMRR